MIDNIVKLESNTIQKHKHAYTDDDIGELLDDKLSYHYLKLANKIDSLEREVVSRKKGLKERDASSTLVIRVFIILTSFLLSGCLLTMSAVSYVGFSDIPFEFWIILALPFLGVGTGCSMIIAGVDKERYQ